MQRLNGSYVKVKAIYIKGCKDPITDCTLYFAEPFVIVFKGAEDTAPTWYNINVIERLEGVEASNPQNNNESRIVFI